MAYPGYPMGSADDLETLAHECRALGVDCLTFAADVRDDVAVSAAVHATLDRFGAIDILFNNAGICGYGLAHELTEDAWDSMLDINLKGPWLVARRVIPIMIERRKGVIINNSSVAGLRGMGRLSHYAASKWGLVGLTRSWAIELAPYNIRVISLCPTGRQHADERRPGHARRENTARNRRTLRRQPPSHALDRARGRRRGGRVSRVFKKPGHHRLRIHSRRRTSREIVATFISQLFIQQCIRQRIDVDFVQTLLI